MSLCVFVFTCLRVCAHTYTSANSQPSVQYDHQEHLGISCISSIFINLWVNDRLDENVIYLYSAASVVVRVSLSISACHVLFHFLSALSTAFLLQLPRSPIPRMQNRQQRQSWLVVTTAKQCCGRSFDRYNIRSVEFYLVCAFSLCWLLSLCICQQSGFC